MDFVTPVLDIISRLWDCSATHASYLCKLKRSLISSRTSLDHLKNQRDDVKSRIDLAESNPIEPSKRTRVVDGWLKRVEALENEVEIMLQEGFHQINEGSGMFDCFCCCRPKNCWSGYKLCKLVVKKLASLEGLRSEGEFNSVVAKSQSEAAQKMPTNQVLGMDPKLDEIWRLATEENQVRILGLFGMGGVGKTTLLKKLNNEFLNRSHDFDVVIWVVVSKDLNLEKVQIDIGDSLGLSWPEKRDLNKRAQDIFRVLRKKKFVVLLDDIWQRVDLQNIGIPAFDTTSSSTAKGTKSKVIFTTRSEVVCGFMEADKRIRVDCLDWDEAWTLFQEKVGQEALNCHPKVPKLAQIIAKECCGLPLALITIGRTMASKKVVQQWKHAITVLQRSASDFSGMGDEVLPILKFSYDNLRSDKIKSCFLYCSLYPEDFSIEKEQLIDYWIAEGFIDEYHDMEEARNIGYEIIGCLTGTCLLESGVNMETEVKMHDVVRDLAIWIVSDYGRNKSKYFVPTCNELQLDEWEKAERISLINKSIRKLIGSPNCPNLSTLNLQYNFLNNISDDFFQFTPALRVLNMSLNNAFALQKSITSLVELQYLNLYYSPIIKALPNGFENLVNLKYLILNLTDSLSKIEPGVISCLTKLQVLDLYNSRFGDWEVDGGPSLQELECLKHLNDLGITIKTVLALQRLVHSQKLQSCTRRLLIKNCRGVTSLALSPYAYFSPAASASMLSLANMRVLKKLRIDNCNELEELIISLVEEEEENTLFTTLEVLILCGLPNLKFVWNNVLSSQICCINLEFVSISACTALKDLSWIHYAQGIKTLSVWDSDGIEEIILDEFEVVDQNLSTFSKLETLQLCRLPNLKSICKHSLAFPALETLTVLECSQLKRLPLDTNSARNNTLRRITGEIEWWESLEWEHETIKSTFIPIFKEYDLQNYLSEAMFKPKHVRGNIASYYYPYR